VHLFDNFQPWGFYHLLSGSSSIQKVVSNSLATPINITASALVNQRDNRQHSRITSITQNVVIDLNSGSCRVRANVAAQLNAFPYIGAIIIRVEQQLAHSFHISFLFTKKVLAPLIALLKHSLYCILVPPCSSVFISYMSIAYPATASGCVFNFANVLKVFPFEHYWWLFTPPFILSLCALYSNERHTLLS